MCVIMRYFDKFSESLFCVVLIGFFNGDDERGLGIGELDCCLIRG